MYANKFLKNRVSPFSDAKWKIKHVAMGGSGPDHGGVKLSFRVGGVVLLLMMEVERRSDEHFDVKHTFLGAL